MLETAQAEARSALQHASAVEQQARLNLSYTTIAAPEDGMVGARSLRVGQYVQAGTQLMAIVPLRAVYVVANYKETQLTDVRPGQPVDIAVDTFPGQVVHGVVDSIAPASGQEFALLPPDNATGNFTKIVQRIPVKIVLRRRRCTRGPAAPGHVGRTDDRHARGGDQAGAALSPTAMATDIRVAAEPKADFKVWLAVIGSIIGAFIAVLNIQITNASLPDIQGAIGAGIDDGGWISTAYLVAEIVVIPLTGFLAPVFSLRRYLLANTVLFLVMSVACAFAHDLQQMIVLRAMQGFFGGVLIPLAFTITLTMLPKSKQPIRACDVRDVGDVRTGDRPHHRRLPHRDLWLAVHLLRQPGARRDHARSLAAVAAARADAVRIAEEWRLDRHRHAGHRPRLFADRVGGRQQGRLVRFTVHRPSFAGRRGCAVAVHLDRADDTETVAQSAIAACGAILVSAASAA